MSATLVLIAIIDVWISAIIVGLLAVRERKKKRTVEISKIVDVELPPQTTVCTTPEVTWRPINNQLTQKKSSGGWINISPFWSLCIITMFLIGVVWILNGGKPLT